MFNEYYALEVPLETADKHGVNDSLFAAFYKIILSHSKLQATYFHKPFLSSMHLFSLATHN